MKKALLLFALTLTYSLANAQTIGIGLKAGVNYAGFVGDDAEDVGLESQVGLLGGAVLKVGFSDLVAIKPEILYSAKGTQADKNNQRDEDIKFNLKYIDVPVLVNINAGNLFFDLGPQFGYLLSAKYEDGDKTDVKDDFNKVDFGAVAGIGYMMDNGVNIELRYNMGLRDVFSDDSDYTEKPGYKNSAFQLTLGYMLNNE